MSFYTENDAEMFIAATLSGLGAGCPLFFVGSLGRVLESAGGAAAGLSAVARAGGVVAAVGVLIFAGLMSHWGNAADNLDSAATQALHALNADFFFPLAGGMATVLFATGLVAVRSRALPAWLGWPALVIAVAMFTPLGLFAFLVSVAWVFVASVALAFGPGAARAAVPGAEAQRTAIP